MFPKDFERLSMLIIIWEEVTLFTSSSCFKILIV
jgi:hypothetical protein